MCWLSWKKLTKSLKDGGLGFRDIQKFNDALLAKVSWRILFNPDCLLARVLLGKYSHSCQFLDSKTPKYASHGWRGIVIGRDLLKAQLGKVIGNGKTTQLWNEPWLSLECPKSPMGPAPEYAKEWTVSKLINQETSTWNIDVIRALVPEYEKEIVLIKPSRFGAQDKWVWLPTATREYTPKSGYFEALKLDPNSQEIDQAPMVMWKALQNAFPVGKKLKHRNVNPTTQCHYCSEDETMVHLFFTCSKAAKVWEQTPCKTSLNLSHISSFRSGFDATKSLVCLPPTGIGAGPISPWIIWSIWHAWNQRIFNQ